MEKTKYTFWELISNPEIQKGIEIPMIQRDYAQGRNKPEVEEIRFDFLNDILTKTENHIKNKNAPRLELDFVYGSIDQKKFIPLDGQQRLTTLFLIHWYIALKDKKLSENTSLFSKFSYQTRATSREFCDKLTNPSVEEVFWKELFDKETESEKSISKIIKNQSWFYLNWKHDPTIQSMLVMVDEIHKTFKNTIISFEELISSEKQLITFHFLPINTYGLSDSLYIKMNARGKVLTDFENFKAKFENFINEKLKHLKPGFTDKIDGVWCDLIWDYIKHQSLQKSSTSFDLVDKPLLNLIYYISEMLFYKSNLDENLIFDNKFKTIEQIYAIKGNLEFLYNALDVFVRIGKNENHKENIEVFFNNLFSKNFKENKVALFDENLNLFERCIFKNGFEIKEKLLLYSVFYYFIQNLNIGVDVTENLKDYLRICRNYILSINQKSKDEFIPELRREYYPELIKTLETIHDNEDIYLNLPSKKDLFKYKIDNIKHEIDKAETINLNSSNKIYIHKLEDHKYLKGTIHNFEFNDSNKIQFIADEVHSIWGKLGDGLITRALLSINDYSEWIAGSGFGGVWFFGKGEKWNRILTASNSNRNNIQPVLKTFFEKIQTINELNSESRLNSLINEYIKTNPEKNWRYYFVKYPIITIDGTNIFTFNEENDFKIEKLGGTSLRSFHINCFIHSVIESDILTNKISKECWAKDTYPSWIFMKHSTYMFPINNCWYINAKKRDFTDLIKEFGLEQIEDKNEYKLFPNENKDFVEIAIDFINKIYE